MSGDPARIGAAEAAAELFRELGAGCALVGDLAMRAWLGEDVPAAGTVDVLGMVQTERSRQISKIAPGHGFVIDAAEAERAEELDLMPMAWTAGERPVRVHVLFASNALYGRMVRDAVPVATRSAPLKVIGAEDLALLMLVSDAPEAPSTIAKLRLRLGEAFDLGGLNRKLVSIGLGGKVLT
ncbi:MAG TPA: hypothetical protein VGE86_04445 [Thermoanaerobaculia bacterium]